MHSATIEWKLVEIHRTFQHLVPSTLHSCYTMYHASLSMQSYQNEAKKKKSEEGLNVLFDGINSFLTLHLMP